MARDEGKGATLPIDAAQAHLKLTIFILSLFDKGGSQTILFVRPWTWLGMYTKIRERDGFVLILDYY